MNLPGELKEVEMVRKLVHGVMHRQPTQLSPTLKVHRNVNLVIL